VIALILGLTLPPLLWLGTGFGLAVRELPELWREAYVKWPGNDFYQSDRRTYVKTWFAVIIVCWPVRTPCQKIRMLIDSRDPQQPERERKKLEKSIAELEKEAGLGELHRIGRAMICQHAVSDRKDWACPDLLCKCLCDACVNAHLRVYADMDRIGRAPDIRLAASLPRRRFLPYLLLCMLGSAAGPALAGWGTGMLMHGRNWGAAAVTVGVLLFGMWWLDWRKP
jgi:hypothetical protein